MSLQDVIDYLKSLNKPKQNPKQVKICIDAGHGGHDLGLKSGSKYNTGYKGIMEKDINLEIAVRIAWLCSRHGLGYIMTRWGDRYLSLKERCFRANQAKSRLFISIHNNYANDTRIKGLETFYYKNSKSGKKLAGRLQEVVSQIEYTRNRYVKPAEFYVLKHTKMPAVLIELGYLTNPKDASFLDNENNQVQVAIRIWEFIKEVCYES